MRLIPSTPPNVTVRTVRLAWSAVGVIAFLILIGGIIWLVRLSIENDAQERSIAESDAALAKLSKQADDEHAAAQALKEQVKRLGGKPVAEPGEPPVGPQGPGPTASQVKAAVVDYCAGDRCKPTVSRSQVAAAVADYCAGGRCLAKDGTDGGPGQDGSDGADGADGTDGAPGPGPTDEQIAAAVAAYCDGGGNCGEDGADGQDGKDGADGKDATFTPSGMDCPDGERVSGVHLLADGSLTVSCAPLLSR
ncbi:MAG TPA: hypothetical protein VJL80_14375 [Aeromicrobium sp.]|nr:hypothetical protein [Aeromicrobium sp.]HKY59219.1 hypothetical protein [Aeromicrobium sp.]